MAINFALYTDAGLTIPVTGNIVFEVAEDGSSGWVQTQLWFGSVIADRRVQDDASPGVSNITFTIVDLGGIAGLSPSDAGVSDDGIVWNTPTLDTGLTQIESGVVNAYSIFVRAQVFSGATAGSYIDLRLETQLLRETAVP